LSHTKFKESTQTFPEHKIGKFRKYQKMRLHKANKFAKSVIFVLHARNPQHDISRKSVQPVIIRGGNQIAPITCICNNSLIKGDKKFIKRRDNERELSLRRHRTPTTKYNRLVHQFRHRSTRRLRVEKYV